MQASPPPSPPLFTPKTTELFFTDVPNLMVTIIIPCRRMKPPSSNFRKPAQFCGWVVDFMTLPFVCGSAQISANFQHHNKLARTSAPPTDRPVEVRCVIYQIFTTDLLRPLSDYSPVQNVYITTSRVKKKLSDIKTMKDHWLLLISHAN